MRSVIVAGGLVLAALSACSASSSTAKLPPLPSSSATPSAGPSPAPSTSPAPVTASASTSPVATAPPPLPTSLGPTFLAPSVLPTDPKLTADQAYALVRRAYDAANLAFTTGDTSAYDAAVGKGCKCRTLITFVRGLAAKHERLHGGLFVDVKVVDFKLARSEATVSAFYTGSKGSVTDAHGQVINTVPANAESQDAITLQFDGRSWYVADISTLSQGAKLP